MKLREKNEAIDLRKRGMSLKGIARELNVSRGSVSYWIRGVVLPPTSETELKKRRIISDEKRRTTVFNKTAYKLRILEQNCVSSMGPISQRDLFVAGLMLYAGEGAKHRAPHSQRVEFTNADPFISQIFVQFLLKCCSVERRDIRLRLFLYEDMDENAAKQFWGRSLELPLGQFSKTLIKKRIGGLPSRKAEYGTIHVLVYNKALFQKIMGWIKAFHQVLSGCGSIG